MAKAYKNKDLDDLSIDELGQLFPIIISKYDSEWINLFNNEKQYLQNLLKKEEFIRIEHIGSTAVPGLIAKPTIDILLEIHNKTNLDLLKKKFNDKGYHLLHQSEKPSPQLMFVKGYSMNGYQGQCYHIHVRYEADHDELYFRDYLKNHPEIAALYAKLKTELSIKHRNNREDYTNNKSEFIKKYTAIAKHELK